MGHYYDNEEIFPIDIETGLVELENMVKRDPEQGKIWKYLKGLFPSLKIR